MIALREASVRALLLYILTALCFVPTAPIFAQEAGYARAVDLANKARRAGKSDEAEKHIKDALKLAQKPGEKVAALVFLAEMSIARKRHARARLRLDQAQKIVPSNARVKELLASLPAVSNIDAKPKGRDKQQASTAAKSKPKDQMSDKADVAAGGAAAAALASAPALVVEPSSETPLPASEAGKVLALERTIAGHKKEIFAAAVSGDGRVLVTFATDNHVNVWSVPGGKQIASHKYDWRSTGDQISLSRDGRIVAIGHERDVVVMETKTGRIIKQFKKQDVPESRSDNFKWVAVQVLDGGRVLAVGKMIGNLYIYDVLGGRRLQSMVWPAQTNFTGTEFTIRFTPDGARMYAGCEWCRGGSVAIWSVADGKLQRHINSPSPSIRSMFFSPDLSRVAIPRNNTFEIYSLTSGSKVLTLGGVHRSSTTDAAFAPGGHLIVTTDRSGQVAAWSPEGKLLQTGLQEKDGFYATPREFAFSPDGRRLVVAGISGKGAMGKGGGIHIYDVSRERLAKLAVERQLAEDAARKERKREEQARREAQAKAEQERAAAVAARDVAMKTFQCATVRELDAKAGGNPRYAECLFEDARKSGAARDLFITAGRLEAIGDRGRAKQLYMELMDRHPKDDLAIKASEQVAILSRLEGAEQLREAADRQKRAADAEKSACAHVYIGKRIDTKVLFGLGLVTWEVIGFSPQTRSVTVRDIKGSSGSREISCSQVPR